MKLKGTRGLFILFAAVMVCCLLAALPQAALAAAGPDDPNTCELHKGGASQGLMSFNDAIMEITSAPEYYYVIDMQDEVVIIGDLTLYHEYWINL